MEILPLTESLLVVDTNPLIPSSTFSVILPESVSDTPLIVSECCKPPSSICIVNLSLFTILCSSFNHQTCRGFEILHLRVVVAFSYTNLSINGVMILQGNSNNNNTHHIKLMPFSYVSFEDIIFNLYYYNWKCYIQPFTKSLQENRNIPLTPSSMFTENSPPSSTVTSVIARECCNPPSETWWLILRLLSKRWLSLNQQTGRSLDIPIRKVTVSPSMAASLRNGLVIVTFDSDLIEKTK